ncbi:MAG: hypothetical protein Q8R53_01700 [Nanoarchaeota archaeon]|nr:hypothetical protein [Nanoarchaeota archaeon]
MQEQTKEERREAEYLRTNIHLLPTTTDSIERRLLEIADAEYRTQHKIIDLALDAYEGKIPLSEILLQDTYADDRRILMGNRILRVFLDEAGSARHPVPVGFETIKSFDTDEGTIEYVLIDDVRKYRIEFTAEIPAFKEEE